MIRFSAALLVTLPVAAGFGAAPALAQYPLPPPGTYYEERLPPLWATLMTMMCFRRPAEPCVPVRLSAEFPTAPSHIRMTNRHSPRRLGYWAHPIDDRSGTNQVRNSRLQRRVRRAGRATTRTCCDRRPLSA